jgi:hypothetical protein
MTKIDYTGKNEAEITNLAAKIFGREANLGFKYLCSDPALLPAPETHPNIIVLSTADYELLGYKNALFVKLPDIPLEIAEMPDNSLESLLPVSKRWSSEILVTDAHNCPPACVGLDRYNYMRYPKVVCITKERSQEPDYPSWKNMGYRCVVLQSVAGQKLSQPPA